MAILFLVEFIFIFYSTFVFGESASVRQVYLVPHSHCDAGWLVTYEQYYIDSVQSIWDTMTDVLQSNPSARFSWAETIWFQMWWENQTLAKQTQVKSYLQNGQLEFIGGGWVMNDEPLALWSDVIDQVTLGHRYLQKELGEIARVRHGWQIDMFTGYSSVTPTLWALMGYDATVIRFAGYQNQLSNWNQTKDFEFVWRGSRNIDAKESEIFTHVMEHNYGDIMGAGFDWERIPNIPVNSTTIAQRAIDLAGNLTLYSSYYRNLVLAPWGNDFRFADARSQFGNMSLIINYINARPDQFHLNIRYSTLADFFDALHNLTLTWPAINDLNFEVGWPHILARISNTTMTYQTGALTSRPVFKQMIRDTNRWLRSAEIAYSIGRARFSEMIGNETLGELHEKLLTSRRAKGVVQHHDSLAGTMSTATSNRTWDSVQRPSAGPPGNQACLEDYEFHLRVARNLTGDVLCAMVGVFAGQKGEIPVLNSTLDNPDIIDEETSVAVLVWNSLSWSRKDVVEVIVNRTDLAVFNSSGSPIPSQLTVRPDYSMALYFIAECPPVGFSTYFISVSQDEEVKAVLSKPRLHTQRDSFTIENNHLIVYFDGNSGLITGVKNKISGVTVSGTEKLMNYINGTGGAYLLIESQPAFDLAPPVVYLTSGPIFQQVHFHYGKNIHQSVNLYSDPYGTASREIEYTLEFYTRASVDINHELIMRFSTDIKTDGHLFNDHSGLETHKRTYNSTLGIVGNYCPLVETGYIKDTKVQLTVYTRESHGMASLQNGQLEVMLHRSTSANDKQGPWPLNDTTTIDVRVRASFDTPAHTEEWRPKLKTLHEYPVIPLFGVASGMDSWISSFNTSFQAFTKDTPENVHLLTLEVPHKDSKDYDLRLHHLYEKGVSHFSNEATVDVDKLFNGLVPSKFEERTLSLWMKKSDLHRQQWKVQSEEMSEIPQAKEVKLRAIQMKTFSVEF